MQHTKRSTVVTLILAVVLVSARDRCASQSAAAAQSLRNERGRLAFAVGDFATETSIPAMPSAPNGASGKGTSHVRWSLDSMFVIIDELSTNTLFGKYAGHGILGFEPQTGQYFLSMFNNFGDHPIYRGGFVGDTLILETRIPMRGSTFDQRLVWYSEGDGVRMQVLNNLGKGYVLVLEQKALPFGHETKKGVTMTGMSHKDLFARLTGKWEGTCRTWFEPGILADESPVSGEFTGVLESRFLLHSYKGMIQGKPRRGEELIAFNSVAKVFQTSWVDDFHMNYAILFSQGKATEMGFSVKGTYDVGENQPGWGWRTEFELLDDDHLTITAYNVHPQGEEAKAVETRYHRAK